MWCGSSGWSRSRAATRSATTAPSECPSTTPWRTRRQLDATDAGAFATFEGTASEQDRDDTYVELDHWVVFGAFEDDSPLADFGVLTLPAHRGQGHAREVVYAMARHVMALGYEPQYRCPLDNVNSVTLARTAGFADLGTWDTLLPTDQETAN